jgi:hypothetical protein
MADSPAASATIGMNLTMTKILVFALSGAIAGFAGAMLGLSIGALSVGSFPFFAGLPLVLLLAVYGVRYPVSGFLGALGLASFPALQEVLGNPSWLSSIALIGPGLAAISMAFKPEGAVFYMGRDMAGILPWRRDARQEKALAVAKDRELHIEKDEIGDLGLGRPFTLDKVAQLDRALHVADELARLPSETAALAGDGDGKVRDAAPVG